MAVWVCVIAKATYGSPNIFSWGISVGIWLMTWSRWNRGLYAVDNPPAFTKKGAYSLTPHPQYVSYIAIILILPMYSHLSCLWLYLLIPLYIWRGEMESKLLAKRFSGYGTYQDRFWAWLPTHWFSGMWGNKK